MYNYQSDTTLFLNKLIEENPELQQERMKNRGMLWDVVLNPEDEADFKAAALPKPGYVYQTE